MTLKVWGTHRIILPSHLFKWLTAPLWKRTYSASPTPVYCLPSPPPLIWVRVSLSCQRSSCGWCSSSLLNAPLSESSQCGAVTWQCGTCVSIRIALRGNQCSAILRLSDENMGHSVRRRYSGQERAAVRVSVCIYTLYKWHNFHWGWIGGTVPNFDLVDTVSLNRVAFTFACQKPDAGKKKVLKTWVEHLIHPELN